eukprot:9408107-Pyramimonas_sp.AAC.1
MVVSGGLSKGIQSTRVILESDLKTHTPAQMKFYPTLADIKFLTYSKPPVIPAQCPIGPCPEPPSWDDALDCATYGLSL